MNSYIQTKPINAVQMENDFELDTPYGVIKGSAGDYVVDDSGYQIHYPKEAFENSHRKLSVNKNSLVMQYMEGLSQMADEGFWNDISTRNYEDEGEVIHNLRAVK